MRCRKPSSRGMPFRFSARRWGNPSPLPAVHDCTQTGAIGYFAKIASTRLNTLSMACSGAIPSFMTEARARGCRNPVTPAVAWALEAARVCLVIFGPVVGCWTIGFGMGYRRGIRDAATGRVFNPGAG